MWSLSGCMTLNHSSKLCVHYVVIIGLYDPKTGSKLGLSGPKRVHKLACNTLNPKPGSNLGYGPKNGVRNGLFTLKLDLWRAFGYTGFSVYGLFGRGAFGYTGFSVVTPRCLLSWVIQKMMPKEKMFQSFLKQNLAKLEHIIPNSYAAR
jgi:hypothetical protein